MLLIISFYEITMKPYWKILILVIKLRMLHCNNIQMVNSRTCWVLLNSRTCWVLHIPSAKKGFFDHFLMSCGKMLINISGWTVGPGISVYLSTYMGAWLVETNICSWFLCWNIHQHAHGSTLWATNSVVSWSTNAGRLEFSCMAVCVTLVWLIILTYPSQTRMSRKILCMQNYKFVWTY